MKQPSVAVPAILIALAFAAGALAEDSTYWKDYRGPGRLGFYDETEILTEWPSSGLEQVWKIDVGVAYSGITTAAGKVFTIEQRKEGETVAAYDFVTGKQLWTATWPGKYSSFMGGKGPRSTPVWDDGRVYALGALGELKCLNAEDGQPIWSKNILTDNGARNARWGTSSSPLVAGDLLITTPGGAGGNSVVAYNKMTGDRVWGTLDEKPGYASPMLAEFGGAEQLLIVNGAGVYGLTPDKGEQLWHYAWHTKYNVNAAQPVLAGENRFMISSGYGHGAALVEVTGSEGSFEAKALWTNKFMKNKFNTSVYHDGHFYGLDEGILACLDAATGERKWKGGRYSFGQVLLAAGHLIITAASGEAVLVEATPEAHREISRFQAVEGKTWNTPALSAGHLLLRSTKQMASFRLAP
jgi:outer membrane protein assembly factor BamB